MSTSNTPNRFGISNRFGRSRLCLCLLVALASVTTVAAAREVKLAAGSASCQQAHHDEHAPATTRATTPAVGSGGETRAKPSASSDAVTGGRLQTPRWHSFLPGMFR